MSDQGLLRAACVVAGVLAALLLVAGACAPETEPVDPAVAAAVQALRDGGPLPPAVEALSDHAEGAVPALLSLAEDESAPTEARRRALHIVGCLGPIAAEPAARIAALLADAGVDDGVASQAGDELDRVQPFPRDAVEAQLAEDAPHRAHRRAAWLLGRHADGDVAALLSALDREESARASDGDAQCRVELRFALVKAAPGADATLQALERGASAAASKERDFAVLELAHCGEPGLRVLARLVDEGVDASQRYRAVRMLCHAGSAAALAVPVLVRCAQREADGDVQARAVEALGAIGVFDADSVAAIRAGFAADDAGLRAAAATASGAAPAGMFDAELWRAVDDTDEDVAATAVSALASRREIAADALEPLLAASSSRVRGRARWAWADRVSRDDLLAELASHRLGIGDDVLVTALARFPEDLSDSWSRVAGLVPGADDATQSALIELGAQVGEPAVPVLAAIAAPGVRSESIAAAVRAAEVLEGIGTPSAWEALASIDTDSVPCEAGEYLRARTIPALVRVGGDDAATRARIVAALAAPSRDVRFRVALAIVREDRAWAAELVREGRLDLVTLFDFDYRCCEDDRRNVIDFAREAGAGVPGVRGRLLLLARSRGLSAEERAECEAAAAALRECPR